MGIWLMKSNLVHHRLSGRSPQLWFGGSINSKKNRENYEFSVLQNGEGTMNHSQIIAFWLSEIHEHFVY